MINKNIIIESTTTTDALHIINDLETYLYMYDYKVCILKLTFNYIRSTRKDKYIVKKFDNDCLMEDIERFIRCCLDYITEDCIVSIKLDFKIW